MRMEVNASFDPGLWDEFVASQEMGHYMQSYAWGQFQRSAGWTVNYCVVHDGGALRASALVLSRPVPGTGTRVLYSPRGPVSAVGDREAVEVLLDGLRAHVARENGVFLRCDPYWTEMESAHSNALAARCSRVPRDWSSWNAPRFVFWLDLSGSEEVLFKRLSSGCRNEVRRGYKSGVDFSLGRAEHIDEFYQLLVLTGQQKGIAFHGVEYYRNLFEVLNASAKVQLFCGRVEGELIAGGISVIYGRKAWLLYAASAPAHYKLRANRTIQWEMIKWAHESGCSRYDFRGTATNDPPSPADPGYGVYEFKKSFGPEFTRTVGYYDLVNRPMMYRALRYAEDSLLPIAYRVRTWLNR